MRPVERGDVPVDKNGNEKVYGQYQHARGDLINCLGEFCSYCEMHLDSSLAVEHVQPKSRHLDFELEWHNFLLACGNCNPTKGDQEISLDNYLWPDRDNTFLAFEYCEDGIIVANANLEPIQLTQAKATLRLLGLDKTKPGNNPAMSDRRLINRQTEWSKATDMLQEYESASFASREILLKVLSIMVDKYWSIWMTVFQNHHEVVSIFIHSQEFPGTSRDCFDDRGKAIPRVGGQL